MCLNGSFGPSADRIEPGMHVVIDHRELSDQSPTMNSLVVYAGDNDLGDGRSPGEVARWFEELIAKVDRDLFDGYYDQDVYFQTPSHFIPNLIDSHALDSLRRLEITLAVGDTDPFCENTRQLSGSLWEKGVPNRLDLWKGEAHCAREWRQMVPVYL